MDGQDPSRAAARNVEAAASASEIGASERLTSSAGDADRLRLLLDSLSRSGALPPQARERAERLAERTGERIDLLISNLGIASERIVAFAWADALGLAFCEAKDLPPAPLASPSIKPQFLRKRNILPVAATDETLTLVLSDPLDDYATSAIAFQTGLTVEACVATPTDLQYAIERLYPVASPELGAELEQEESEGAFSDDVERLKDLASDAPVVAWVNDLIARAIEARASDIHVEPSENGLRVRMRVDGALRNVEPPSAAQASAIVPRIKIMAKLNISERRLPQDGRIKMTARGRRMDVRVATSPSLHGESAVLRILDADGAVATLPELGFRDDALRRYRNMLRRPNGILLVTGPTGSGKTTTLYASLLELNAPDRKLFSIEDPIEYQLDGVTQIQIKPSIGLTFASALRSMLRQDPDVMMVGEIRDVETAEIAVESALTGHLVLSTLHTNSAAATLTRLSEMGVAPYLLSATIVGVVAQRLVRRLCPDCRAPGALDPDSLAAAGITNIDLATATPFEPRGCARCGMTGYRGRLAILEVLPTSDSIKSLIAHGAAQHEIEAAAVGEGMTTMLDDGVAKALRGETTIEEVLRSANLRI